MDAQTAINKLVENLSFQVLTGPCKVHITNNVSKNATGTPVNVKIKLRHKDDKNNRDIFSMSKIENSNNANKLRLVNSDQTITSFNLLMDSDDNKKSSKKSQNKILHLFKPGACLRNQNKDDDYTYMPESNKNKEYNASKTEDKDEKEKFGLMKNYIIEDEPFDDPVRRPKMFLGKCKPGGCLDPPFDEDKYSYEPVKMNKPVKEQKYSTQKPSDVIQNEILNNAESEKIYLRSPSKQQDSFVEKDITTGSLITYPPNVCNQPGSQKDSVEIKFKTKKQALPPNTNEYLQAFYTPPKSKETSISSKTIDIVENENVVVQNQNQTSLSKDSVMPTIGGPAALVLPDTITLSTIESILKNSQNNIAEQKMNNNKETISCNEINEAPVILASPLIDEKRSDNMVKCDNDNLRYLQIVNLLSEENFEEFPTSMAPSIKKSQDKEIKQGDEIFCKETNKDLVKNKDIIVIAPIKKSTDTNNTIESQSEINSTISKNKNSESLIDDKNMEILKLNPLKQEPEEIMEITKNNSQIDSFTPPDDIKLKRTSSIKPNKPPQTVNQESFKIEKINAPDDLSFTLNTEDVSDTKTANDSHATIDTNAEQHLDKENSTILRTNQSPQALFDSQQELIKKVSSHMENKEFTNDEIDSIQKMPNQNNIHNESKSDVFGRLSGKMSIASSTKQLQKEVQHKISSSSNVELSQTLKPNTDNGSIYKQDSKPIFAKTSAYNIHNFRDDINTIKKVDESVESTDFYEKKMFNDDTKVRNEYIDNNYQEIGDKNLSNDPKDILNITTVSPIDDIDRQNIPSSLNNDSHKEYPETVKIYSAADQTLKAAESIQINASNFTTNSIQKPNKDASVHQGDDEQYTAMNEISRSTNKDIIKQKRLSKENEPDIKKREGKKEQLPYHQAQRKSATSSKHADTKTMPIKLPNKNKFENNLIHLDFALHLTEDGNETVIKTFDSECLPESINKTPMLFKYAIKANEDKIKIPVNANTNLVLEINNSLKNKKYTKGISNGLSSPNKNKETNAHTLSKMNIMLQETITSIYEQNLVPVETMIRELKEDVEALVQNQKIIKQMLKASKHKPNHVSSNGRCGCYRK